MDRLLDTSFVVAQERLGRSALQVAEAAVLHTDRNIGVSVIALAELNHGVFRASTTLRFQTRRKFVEELTCLPPVYPVTPSVALLAGRIPGEQARFGFIIDFAHILIGATALELGFAVLTHDLRHFRAIPGLNVECA